MKAPLVLLLALGAMACSTGRGPRAPLAPGDENEMTHAWNREARAGAVVESLHGVEVVDPYRLLESEGDVTSRWVAAQTERTAAALDAASSPAMRARLETLLTIGTIGDARLAGGRLFYTRREGEREQPRLVVRDPGDEASRTLLDPETLGERVAIDWYYPSPDGSRVAFGRSSDGDERSVLHVIDVASGALLPDRIERTKWASLAWLGDGSGFYYTRYPAPSEAGFDPDHPETYHPRVFFHRLGSPPEDDLLVFASDEPTDFPSVHLSADDRWLTLNVFRGWSESDVFLLDRGLTTERIDRPDPEHPLLPVFVGEPHLYSGGVHAGRLLLRTDEGAERYRIIAAEATGAGRREGFRTLIAEREAPIEDWEIFGDRIVVHYIESIASRLRIHDLDGNETSVLPLPSRGEVGGLAADPLGHRIAFTFSGPLEPPSLFVFDGDENVAQQVDRVETDLDLDGYIVELVEVLSADGAAVPVEVIRPRDLPRDRSARALVYGYGGFNVSLLPSFARNVVYWLEQGGVYLVAHIRGGGELGEAWHRAGNLENKEKGFEDFEAVLRWTHASGIAEPARIGITGGSNGGLLMGAMVTRSPELFGAAASYVGLYDMLRYHHFPPAELWIAEYGSADDPLQFDFLRGYSPYHRVRQSAPYPAILLETADHDSRVHWSHTTKFAAALQEATGSARPIYFFMEREVGHGAGTRRSDIVARYVRMYAFLESTLQADPAGPSPRMGVGSASETGNRSAPSPTRAARDDER